MKNLTRYFLGLLAIFLLVACQQSDSTKIANPILPAQNQVGLIATLTPLPTSLPSPTPTLTSTRLPTATATSVIPTSTASPVPTSLPTPTIEARQPITFTALSMADEWVGWAVTPANHIVRTTDSGLTWKDVTPKNLAAENFSSFFLNPEFDSAYRRTVGSGGRPLSMQACRRVV